MIADLVNQSGGELPPQLSESRFFLPLAIAFAGRDDSWKRVMKYALDWVNVFMAKIASQHGYKLLDILLSKTPLELESDFDDDSITLTLLHEGFQYSKITFKKEEA